MLAGSILLLATLVLEWKNYRAKESDFMKRAAGKSEALSGETPAEIKSYELPNKEAYTEMVERPLFLEGRRPVVEEPQEQPAADNTPLTIKLMGVVFSPGANMALFIDDKGKYKRVKLNDAINGWKLAQIKSDRAIMEQNGSTEELKLVKPRPKKIPAAPNPLGQRAPNDPNNPNMPNGPVEAPQPPIDENDPNFVPPPEEISNDQ